MKEQFILERLNGIKKHIVSVEPMLEEINIEKYLSPVECALCNPGECENVGDSECRFVGNISSSQLGWVICGGETGRNARPVHPDWVRSLRDQAVSAGVPFFFKQWGEYCAPNQMNDAAWRNWDCWHGTESCWDLNDPSRWRIGKKAAGNILDGTEWEQMSERGAE